MVGSTARKQIRDRAQMRADLCECFVVHCVSMTALFLSSLRSIWLGLPSPMIKNAKHGEQSSSADAHLVRRATCNS